ncbi:MAG: hypothetical protein M3N19_01275 [Candidatus Eremiobacteraeota bacterium]|nr:hypothetical protein [Candidatus Eremiobacteraeota bacterium]
MFIVTLLVLTVFLSYTLAGAAQDASVLELPVYPQRGPQSYKMFARDLILSNRFWIYLVLGIGITLLASTSLAIAFIMHVRMSAIAAIVFACIFFCAQRAFSGHPAKRIRVITKLCKLSGAASGLLALVILLRS